MGLFLRVEVGTTSNYTATADNDLVLTLVIQNVWSPRALSLYHTTSIKVPTVCSLGVRVAIYA